MQARNSGTPRLITLAARSTLVVPTIKSLAASACDKSGNLPPIGGRSVLAPWRVTAHVDTQRQKSCSTVSPDWGSFQED
jgi:hypothetical protein